MKKTLLFCIALLTGSLLISPSVIAGGKSFEGIITFKISYPDNKFTESQLAMFPKVLVIKIRGDKARSEIQTPMGNQVEITDYTTQSKIGLLDIMGQKYAIKSTLAEIQKEMASQPKGQVQLTGETKVIAGYTCKKAIITVDDKGSKYTIDVYYTPELGPKEANFDNPLYKDIEGVLLEFSMKTQQFTMRFTATSVEKKSIPASEFEIPSDYVITTQEELKSKFGGMTP